MSWSSVVSKLNEIQKTDLLNRMAAFVLGLHGVEKSIFTKNILAPRHIKLTEALQALFESSTRFTTIPEFVHPVVISQGPTATGYTGKGLRDVHALVDEGCLLDIWKHLCGALDEYYSFLTSAQDCQWHALAMAIVTTLSAYQLCVNSAPELFPGIETSDLDAAIPRPRRTRLGSGTSGPTPSDAAHA
jgi:hypothetical protein